MPKSFFHDQYPFKKGYLDTKDGHQLYFERYGSENGKPVIILHGGPGYGSNPSMTRFFNPQKWNVLLFDQRGTGLSKPSGNVHSNTTSHLISDINLLADYVGFNRFVIIGESWGTTLALAYSQLCPERVVSLILVGVFLGEDNEALICKVDGVQRHFPDYWSSFINALSDIEQRDPINSYAQHIMSDNLDEQEKFCKEAIILELATEAIGISRESAIVECEKLDYLNIARIEYHYLRNHYFLEPGQLLNSCGKIENILITIIHGRYDMVCPPESAWKLHNRLRNSTLYFADLAGHSTSEQTTSKLLIKSVKRHLL